MNAPSGLTFSSTMPGGFEQLQVTLARRPSVDYTDLEEFETVTVNGVGGQVAWQGRLETTPRTSGDQISIMPGAVGWQAALDDDQSASMVYVDRDLSRWRDQSVQRQINQIAANEPPGSFQAAADPATGNPSLILTVSDAWASPTLPVAEVWYDAGSDNVIAKIYLDNVASLIAGWTVAALVSSDDIATSSEGFGSNILNNNSSGGAYFNPVNRFRWALFQQFFNATPSGAAGFQSASYMRNVAVYGNHGLTSQGTDPQGLHASDIVTHAVSTWAPRLSLTDTGGASTITPSTFIIPQAVYADPTTAGNIVTDVTKYELQDWAVWEGPTFWWYPRNGLGRSWRARVGPSGLSETGPQVDRIYNAVIVTYNDVTGASRTVGPTGSGADTIDNSLADQDPSNPATLAGLNRTFELPNIGVSVAGAAIQVGQAWLVEQKAVSTAGQAQITGYVQDSSGVTWPAWMIRAGDDITFVDAHDPVPRRIVKTSYDNDTKINQLDLDSPPEGLQALLARLGAADAALGF